MTFCLYRSNRVERLAQTLAQVVREPLSNPLSRECIVVQGPGMERWLSAQLASQLRVWANPWFPFPRAVVELSLDAALGPVPEDERVFEPAKLTFAIARALDAQLEDAAFADVRRYLANDVAGEARLALSGLLANLYDQYLVYRPELVLGWERGADEHFQAKLWRALTSSAAPTHVARRMEQFQHALRNGSALDRAEVEARGSAREQNTAMPERISLFGISTLPPAFLNVLTQLSERIDVHLFVLSPSPEYWGDFDRKLARGNSVRSLLANLGKLSRDFVELLLDGTQFEEPCPELFELRPAPQPDGSSRARLQDRAPCLLAHLQADLAELRERDPTSAGENGAIPLRDDDRSLSVHVCHSPIRELEVLRDELRARFESDKTLEARDVVVFAPDIEGYAPAIEAVFSQLGADGEPSIPFRIADRKASRSSELMEAFFALLELVESRLFLSDVLDFLHRAPVRGRFDIDESELDLVQRWLVESGARWAVDGAHRKGFGQPAYEQNSFRFALNRLLVGYASAQGERRDVLGVLPHPEIEGEQAELLGRLARFAERLFQLVETLKASRSVQDWSKSLIEALTASLSEDEELGYEHQGLRNTLATLAADASAADFHAAVSLRAVRALLQEHVDKGRANLGFLSNGITFCEHVPMRAIPFRVVCMVGMDDESFPRRAPRPSFDLTAEQERRGDRTLREDDRQLFLEAMLSARDALIITYVGRSAKDDGERPASVLVEQLLRVVDRHFVRAGADQSLCLDFERKNVSASLTRVHALHRFDARYFRGPASPYFSYDESAASAARALSSPRRALTPFIAEPVPARELTRLDLEELVRFFRAPQRAFLQGRLRVQLPRAAEDIPDREPTAIASLERYRLYDRLLTDLDGHPAAEQQRILRGEGSLPPGTTGDVVFEDMQEHVQEMLAAARAGVRLGDRSLALTLQDVVLAGRLRNVYERARVEYTAASARHKHKLGAWIRHLALCASGASPQRSVLVARTEDKKKGEVSQTWFRPVAEAASLLHDLISLYRLGMQMPLPFLPNSSGDYAEALQRKSDREDALRKATPKAAVLGQGMSELDDRHVRQIWSEEELKNLASLSATDGTRRVSFAEVAERVLSPMFEHMEPEDAT